VDYTSCNIFILIEFPFSKLRFFSEVQDFSSLNFHYLSLGEMRATKDRNYFKVIELHFALVCNVSKLLMSTAESYVFIYHH